MNKKIAIPIIVIGILGIIFEGVMIYNSYQKKASLDDKTKLAIWCQKQVKKVVKRNYKASNIKVDFDKCDYAKATRNLSGDIIDYRCKDFIVSGEVKYSSDNSGTFAEEGFICRNLEGEKSLVMDELGEIDLDFM